MITSTQAIEFCENLKDSNKNIETLEMSLEKFCFAAGLFWQEIEKRMINPNGKITPLQHVKTVDTLWCFLKKYYKQTNSKMLLSDVYLTKLLGYLSEGAILYSGERITEELQCIMIHGISANY